MAELEYKYICYIGGLDSFNKKFYEPNEKIMEKLGMLPFCHYPHDKIENFECVLNPYEILEGHPAIVSDIEKTIIIRELGCQLTEEQELFLEAIGKKVYTQEYVEKYIFKKKQRNKTKKLIKKREINFNRFDLLDIPEE